MKRILLCLFAVAWLGFGVYVLLPSPAIPELPNSVASGEPDTRDVENLDAYYNNMTREQVIEFYKNSYNKTDSGIRLPTYVLNHPPEYARQRVRDELFSWYLEEVVHPFRESLYVSGWTPALAQLSQKWKQTPLEKNGQYYFQKTTIRSYPTTAVSRFLVYGLTTAAVLAMYFIARNLFAQKVRD